jgi:hypothetical protein
MRKLSRTWQSTRDADLATQADELAQAKWQIAELQAKLKVRDVWSHPAIVCYREISAARFTHAMY